MISVEKSFAGVPFQLQAANRQVDLEKLPPFLRVLLTTDGTVTSALEAYFWEPIQVDTLSQGDVVLSADAPAIECRAGEQVLRRDVQLRGAQSQRVYVRAESMIRSELLAPEFRTALIEGRLGVGELLRECGLETYRQVLSVRASGADCGDLRAAEYVQRTYRIVMDHHPFIEITEYFPIALY